MVGVDRTPQEMTGEGRERSRLEISETVLEPLGSNTVKDKLEFSVRSLTNNPLSSCSDSPLFICNYSGVSGLEYLSLSREGFQFQGTHHDLLSQT